MRALRYHEFGGPEVLQLDDITRQEPGPTELVVEMKAVSVNPIDHHFREGFVGGNGDDTFQESRFPAMAGTDLAGTVAAVGDEVGSFSPGDRVFGTGMAAHSSGTIAEYAVVPAQNMAHLPDAVSFETGAGIAHVGGTAWRALIEYGRLRPTAVCLIHGASGGVGHAAIQLANAVGAKVIGTAGSEAARNLVADLGADTVLDYHHPELRSEIEAQAGGGMDVILDPHTGTYLELDVSVARYGATILNIGGPIPEIPNGESTMTKELSIQGVAMHNTPNINEVMANLATLLSSGELTANIDRTFDFKDAAEAFRVQAEERILGKVVITS